MPRYKLGANLAAPRPRLKFEDYLRPTPLPTPPAVFGHQNLITEWGMLGNDTVGDCAVAGPAHLSMLWARMGGRQARFDDASVLAAYSAITGYDPADPATDQGSTPDDVSKYWRTHGLVDADGDVHKIEAYVAVQPEHYAVATQLFGGIGLCLALPDTAQAQFGRGEPWDVVRGAQIEGGHYVPQLARVDGGNLLVVTWARLQPATPAFVEKYSEYAIAYLSEEMLTGGKSPEGFDVDQLRADLAAVTA